MNIALRRHPAAALPGVVRQLKDLGAIIPVALLSVEVVKGKSTGVPRSAVQQALQTEFPLQAEFDAFGTRVEGLALELARGLVASPGARRGAHDSGHPVVRLR